ncbi:MAG TPA: 16S rRNA (guanine(966)-N(2))-methyltransferase RsmD [Bacillota bacterium]|nr:16S rRNA (guanine(966)-N(2))-methyltransferase RsmD [Peptococcaceae bacterium MAG4]NLW37450.1 16S rRNA (guanine(966)-N(2))-methyltransferase RsmD [Peptococcaceae bacterium]HPZ43444.1 16S rRNA (guanine(966)-N(2))-methyltransferase RsmD [Bacillota bacterium]HQD76454.1 16S rRNA (guanine(966)-N(2))-methyltransferase RsmD [Bacillota bacterium]HUM58653.1 16S rRNA (guanine(966)-N(2))-methyltransferase RsmD [Bacillota bacterium]
MFLLRVITGTAKNRKLKVPGGLKLRPTSDRVKEALFNILGGLVPGCLFLDMFAGTGNVGIEALSRGAASAVFVEKNRKNAQVIEENLVLTGLRSRARVINQDVFKALPVLGREGLLFDLIFLDPPYLKKLEVEALSGIAANNLLKPQGMVIVESSSRDLLPPAIDLMKLNRQEKYGDTLLSFYSYK